MQHRYFRYVRKSEEDKRKQVISIPAQLAETDRLAEYRRLNIVRTFTEEKTAKSPGRPVFGEMLRRIKAGEADGIICWKANRLTRNPIDAGELIFFLSEGMLHEIVGCDRTYTGNANDKFMLYLDFGLANQYVDNLSEDVSRGNRQMLETGLWPGRPPVGYIRDPRYKEDPHFKELLPDPVRFEQVRQMWRMLLSGKSPAEIRQIANEVWGFTMPKRRSLGGGPISKAQSYALFRNKFYAGLMVRSGGTHLGKHQPMVTPMEFERAQLLIDGNTAPRMSDHGLEFPYRGLVKCGTCGSGVTSKVTINRQGRPYKHYYCYKKDYRSKYCPEGAVNERYIDRTLADYFGGIILPPNLLDQVYECIAEREAGLMAGKASAAERRDRRLGEIQREMERLRTLVRNEVFSEEEYEADKARLVEERARIESLGNEDTPKLLERFRERVSSLQLAAETFLSGKHEEKQELARKLLLELRLAEKKVLVVAKKPFPLLRERPLSLLLSAKEDFLNTLLDEDYVQA